MEGNQMCKAVPFAKTREILTAVPEFRKEDDTLGDEFTLITQAIAARTGKTRAQKPETMGIFRLLSRKMRRWRSRAWSRSNATPMQLGAGYAWNWCQVEVHPSLVR